MSDQPVVRRLTMEDQLVPLYLELDLGFDIASQLRAIKDFLLQGKKEAEQQILKIAYLTAYADGRVGEEGMLATNHVADELHFAAYDDIARSMAAVGMFVPLIETVFARSLNEHRRLGKKWKSGGKAKGEKSLGCNKRTPRVAKDLLQFANETGIATQLPEFEKTLSALFEYRNMMFHHGFEWPADKRTSFARCVKNWPVGWFEEASKQSCKDEQLAPWMFFLSSAFIAHCLTFYRGAARRPLRSLRAPAKV